MQHTVHSWSTPDHSTKNHNHTFCLVHTRAFNKHSHSHILVLLVFIRKTLLLFVFAFLSSRSVEMSSYWDDNYIFGQYSSENWGHESVPVTVISLNVLINCCFSLLFTNDDTVVYFGGDWRSRF
ncbi:hypothetical protein Hanom_Chr15g01384601 [Helianthus anomalus]